MKLRSLRGSKREPREPLREKGTYKINIYLSIVPLVPLVPSIITLACAREKEEIRKKYFLPLNHQDSCKSEGTTGTAGTRGLQIAVFWFPLPGKVPSNSLEEAYL